jgi:uncharacterized protein (DUF1697 family)
VKRYAVLLRGINVGGKNRVPMAELRKVLEDLGYEDVATYIASGNVLLRSDRPAAAIRKQIEEVLPRTFRLDSELVAVHVLTHAQLRAVVDDKPKGFDEQPGTFHSDVLFLMGVKAAEAMPAFDPREGVDTVWPGDGVVYSQRLSAQRTKSRLSKVVSSPMYQAMTIRNWATTTALLRLLDEAEAG